MDYNEVLRGDTIQESIENMRLMEQKYCEEAMELFAMLDSDDEKMQLLESMPQHLREATLQKQYTSMIETLKLLVGFSKEMKSELAISTIITTEERKALQEQVTELTNRAHKLLKRLDNQALKDWFLKVDKNSGLFGGRKLFGRSKGPSRKELGVN